MRTDTERLLDLLDYLVDDRVGVVHSVRETPREPGEPNFFHYAARACNTRELNHPANFRGTGGASVVRGRAVAKAVGEAVERYCCALYNPRDLPLTSAREAGFRCAAPGAFALFSDAQYAMPGFPFVPFDDDTPVRWAPAVNITTGETTYVPAAAIYVTYQFYLGSGEAPVMQPISTGLACHVDKRSAVLSGLCEVIERDCFCIFWQAMLAPPQIRVETLSDANYDVVQRFQATGEVVLLDITLDTGIPTVLAVLRSASSAAPPLVFAASADPDPEVAVLKSLEELDHTRQYAQAVRTHVPRLAPDPTYRNVDDQSGHLNFWCDSRHTTLADFAFVSEHRRDFQEMRTFADPDPAMTLANVIGQVTAVGHDVLVADATSPDVADVGLSVVRAVVPGFHPLFMGHGNRALGGTRLWTVPQQLGHPGVSPALGDNPAPHPYP